MVPSTKASSRVAGIDALRGAVMVIMALDHVRDFFHVGAMSFSPTDLTKTTPALFLTRWITHFCLPVFMFAAGMGAFLWWRQRDHTKAQLSRFLWTRGLWFVVLELTVMRLAYDFNFSLRFLILLLILWIFGICMIAMAALIYLPLRWLAALSVIVIALHNCLDGISASQFGSGAWLWNLIHQPGIVTFAGHPVLVTYTVVPWIAVMGAGLLFRSGVPIGTVRAAADHAEDRVRFDDWVCCDPRSERLWRSGAVVVSEVDRIHCALVSQLHEIPGVARFSAHDAWAGVIALGLPRSTLVQGHQSADCLRASAVILLRPAFLRHPRSSSPHGVAPVRKDSVFVHVQSPAFDGRPPSAVPG